MLLNFHKKKDPPRKVGSTVIPIKYCSTLFMTNELRIKQNLTKIRKICFYELH